MSTLNEEFLYGFIFSIFFVVLVVVNFSQIYFFIPDFLFLMLLLFKRPIEQFSWPNFSYFYDLFSKFIIGLSSQTEQA